ncbi:hypothetical protein FKM82_021132 [Ascaphus truei]
MFFGCNSRVIIGLSPFCLLGSTRKVPTAPAAQQRPRSLSEGLTSHTQKTEPGIRGKRAYIWLTLKYWRRVKTFFCGSESTSKNKSFQGTIALHLELFGKVKAK